MPWDYDPKNVIMPEGEYKVRLDEAKEKTSKRGSQMMEFKINVMGKGSLFHFIVYDYQNRDNTDRKFQQIYKCFGIPEGTQDFTEWRGSLGMAFVKHREDEFYGGDKPYLAYFIPREKRPEVFRNGPTRDEDPLAPMNAGVLDLTGDGEEDTADIPDFGESEMTADDMPLS